MAGFNKGILGSPWSRETYGLSGADPGDGASGADYEDGPRVGPGRFAKRVTAEVSRGGNGNGNSTKKDD